MSTSLKPEVYSFSFQYELMKYHKTSKPLSNGLDASASNLESPKHQFKAPDLEVHDKVLWFLFFREKQVRIKKQENNMEGRVYALAPFMNQPRKRKR